MKDYIQPNIRWINKDDILDGPNVTTNYGQYLEVKELLLHEKLFIVAEPGYGKSRLCEELIAKYEADGYACTFIELKSVKGNLMTYINDSRKKNDGRESIFDRKRPYYFFNNPTEADKQLICFDALDEVEFSQLKERTWELKQYIKDYPNHKIIISSRTHHVKREPSIIDDFVNIVEIDKFGFFQVMEWLKKIPALENKTTEYFEQRLSGYNTLKFGENILKIGIIAIPRYLDILIELIDEKGEDVLEYSRVLLLDAFIKQKLGIEAQKGEDYRRKTHYVERGLMYLALVMEIQRTNTLTKDDFITFLLDIDLNLDSQLLLETFFDRTILKDNGDSIEFENTSFQEYLAAKGLLHLGRSEQVVYDLAIEKKIRHVYPSWIDVLGYAVEIEEFLLDPLIKYACRTEDLGLFKLLNFVSPEFKKRQKGEALEIFKNTFNFYSNHPKWLKTEELEAMSKLYVGQENEEFLEEKYKEIEIDDYAGYVKAGNIAGIYLKLPKGNKNPKWKKRFIEWAEIPRLTFDNNVTQHNSLYALKGIVDKTDLVKLSLDASKQSILANLFHEEYPDSKEAIKFYLSIEDHFSSPLNYISTEAGFEVLFELLNSEEKYSTLFLSKEITLHPNLRERFKKNLNPKIEKQIIIFLVNNLDYYYKRFHIELIGFCCEQNSTFIVSLLKEIIKQNHNTIDELNLQSYELSRWINTPEKLNTIESLFVEESLEKTDFFYWLLQSTEVAIKHKKKLLLKYFPELYKKNEKYRNQNKRKETLQEKRQEQTLADKQRVFLELLDNNDYNVIRDFFRDDKSYKTFLQEEEVLEKFQKMVRKVVSMDFYQNPKMIKNEDAYYMRLPNIFLFSKALKVIQTLNLFIEVERHKLLELIYYHQDQHQDYQVIYDLLGDITEKDEEYFKILYPKYKDVLSISQFLDFAKKNNLKGLSSILKELLKDENITMEEWSDALKILFYWKVADTEFLSKLYAGFVHEEDSIQKTKINELLIKLQDESAVKRITDQILENVAYIRTVETTKFKNIIRSVHPVEQLSEILVHLSSEELFDIMLNFLSQSFEKYKENKDFENYIEKYIWSAVIVYFRRLCFQNIDFVHYLKKLKSLIKEQQSTKISHYFNIYIPDLEREYFMASDNRKAPFANSVKIFNELKNKKYLDIVYPQELFNLVKDVLNNEYKDWVRSGGLKFIKAAAKVEDYLQKNLVPLLEKFLLARGLRGNDIAQIYREVEGVGGERTDLIVSYGPIGPIMIELKRCGNKDFLPTNMKPYKEKMKNYLLMVNAEYGIYLVFRDEENFKKDDFMLRIKEANELYRDTQIEVIGIDCIDPD